MAEVTELNDKKESQTIKPFAKPAPKGKIRNSGRLLKRVSKSKARKKSVFSRADKVLIGITSIVAFGGIVFCLVMLILMTSIHY